MVGSGGRKSFVFNVECDVTLLRGLLADSLTVAVLLHLDWVTDEDEVCGRGYQRDGRAQDQSL
jgi:hypothetical protein